MSAATAPRLSGGIAVSALFHGAVFGAVCVLVHPADVPPMPPIYSVHIVAAPQGERAAGIVQDRPPAPSVEKVSASPSPNRATPVIPARARKAATKPRPAPRLATPVPRTATALPEKIPTTSPTAAGGPTGGKGADVANVDTPGIEFDFPPYTNNIVSQLVRRFGALQGSLSATVRFVIRRDGSVDLESIKIVEPAGSYPFDQRAIGAVESAANARAFGPLPVAFREDILLVRFRFAPSAIR